MEVIEAYRPLNLMLMGGRPRSQSLLGKLQSGELIAPVDLDFEPIRDDLAYTRKIAFSFLMLGSAIGRLSRRPLIGF